MGPSWNCDPKKVEQTSALKGTRLHKQRLMPCPAPVPKASANEALYLWKHIKFYWTG